MLILFNNSFPRVIICRLNDFKSRRNELLYRRIMYRSGLTSDGSKVRRVYDVARERNIGMKFRNSYVTYPLPFN